MGSLSFFHLVLIFGVILIFFGPTRLPQLGNSLGKAIRGFKEGLKGFEDEIQREAKQDPDLLEKPKEEKA